MLTITKQEAYNSSNSYEVVYKKLLMFTVLTEVISKRKDRGSEGISSPDVDIIGGDMCGDIFGNPFLSSFHTTGHGWKHIIRNPNHDLNPRFT